ncbi:hypothetical protein [Spirosoma linguale]|uniref:Uncharacterized protein n=1 Tax=Spirosoma linguale (strain ATCC 33905 / DSM 74 / LMG 10896 / Claus 1) TaxID=504472 RepID=D2QUZ8_SPILD|nr:hypothetical protein Slin_6673 [Spirosoma linguale DSM 74]
MIPQPPNPSQLPTEAGLSLSDWADIANVVVAALAFGFSIYSFWVQRERDRQSRLEAANILATNQKEAEQLRAQTIRLQWYKDLVITPNIRHLTEFYDTLQELGEKITTPDLSDEQKKKLIEEVKEAQRLVRKTLVDSILPINDELHSRVITGLDQLVDGITNAIGNDTLKLSNSTVSEAYIGQPIQASKRDILTLIYGYRGD